MGSQNTKIDTSAAPLSEIMASSPPEVKRFSPPFRRFHHQYHKLKPNHVQITLGIEEPYRGNVHLQQEMFNDLEEAFDSKTKNIQIESVLFDEYYADHYTYLIKKGKKQFGMQLREFTNFNTHQYNNIVCQLHLLQEITQFNHSNLNSLEQNYVIKTRMGEKGEDFPNTQIFILEPISTNLSEIIKYRRQNKWFWSVGEFNSLARDLTKGLLTLHEAGISHNDIRPCNVYYSLQKNCYQLGGYANALKTGSQQTLIGVRGSKYFSAPELDSTTQRNLCHADVYSLGMTLLCAFYLCEPINRKGCSPYNRKYEQTYQVMGVIRQMIQPVERRKSLELIERGIKEGFVQLKMKSLIQSLKYKNSPKQIKLIKFKKALGDAYQRLGLWNQWKNTMYDAFELEQPSLDQSKKAQANMELAKIQSYRGQPTTASELAKKASQIYRSIGSLSLIQGNVNEAIGYFSKAIDCCKFFQNENDLQISRSLQGLALSHAEKGDYEVSKPLIHEACHIIGKAIGKQTIDYCKMKMTLAKIQSDFGEFGQSDSILGDCLTIAQKKAHGEEEVWSKLKAQILQEKGRNAVLHSSYNERQKTQLLKNAEKHISDAMEINQKYPNNHIPLSLNIETFGEIYLRRDFFTQSRNNFKKADLMRDTYLKDNKLQGTMDKEKADLLCNIGFCDTSLGEHHSALENYEGALKIYRQIYGSNHNKYSAIAIGKMSRVYYNLNEKEKARQCLRLGSEILEELNGKDDPDYGYFKRIQETL